MVECQSPVTGMMGYLRAWGALHTPIKVHRPWPVSQNWAGYRMEPAREIVKNPDPRALYLGISGRVDLIWCLVICVFFKLFQRILTCSRVWVPSHLGWGGGVYRAKLNQVHGICSELLELSWTHRKRSLESVWEMKQKEVKQIESKT